MTAYDTALRHAVLFDLPNFGLIEVTGREAATFLHNLCTNDIKNLQIGGGCETFLCNARARTLAYVLVNRLPASFLLDMIPALTEKVYQHLDKHHISEDVDIAKPDLAMLRLAGPEARSILVKILGESAPDAPLLHHFTRDTSRMGSFHVRRQDLLGLPSYDLFCDRDRVGLIRDALLAAGAVMAGPDVHEILRVEAGTPEYGKDMDDNRFVAEVGRTDRTISYAKGCYLGQEPIVMARDRGQVNRALLGIKVETGDILARGTRLYQGGTEVGQTTSSVRSPRLGTVIALAYLKRGSQEAGAELVVEPAAEGRKALVASLPFVAGV